MENLTWFQKSLVLARPMPLIGASQHGLKAVHPLNGMVPLYEIGTHGLDVQVAMVPKTHVSLHASLPLGMEFHGVSQFNTHPRVVTTGKCCVAKPGVAHIPRYGARPTLCRDLSLPLFYTLRSSRSTATSDSSQLLSLR